MGQTGRLCTIKLKSVRVLPSGIGVHTGHVLRSSIACSQTVSGYQTFHLLLSPLINVLSPALPSAQVALAAL